MKKNLQTFFVLFFLCSPLAYSQLSSPVLILPVSNSNFVSADLDITLSWGDVGEALGYFVEVGTDPNQILNGPVVDSVNATSPVLILPAQSLVSNTTYYWRVTARGPLGMGTPSSINNFTTAGTVPQEMGDLYSAVNALNLPNNQGQMLTQRLDQAQRKIDQGKLDQAANKLASFEDRVNDLTNSSIISVSDQSLLNGQADYIISVIRQGDNHGTQANNNTTALTFSLDQNYPNPFNPSTTIEYTIPANSFVSLKIYDMLGREISEVIHKEQNAGHYITFWNASNYSSGVYFYKLAAGNYSQIKKMILAK